MPKLTQVGDDYNQALIDTGFAFAFQSSDLLFHKPNLVDSAFNLILHTLHARRASLLLPSSENPSELVIVKAHGIDEQAFRDWRVAVGSPIAGWIAEGHMPFLLVGDQSDTALLPLTRRAQYSTCSFACVPVPLSPENIGVLNVADQASNRAFDADDLDILLRLANHLASCLAEQRRYQHIWEMARRDPLTGLLNRRMFTEFIHAQALHGADSCKVLSCLMIDLNDFKAINDTYGHPIGDIVLTIAAQAIESQVRPGDMAFRYGGDEFVVFLSNTEWNQARVIAARIQNTLACSTRSRELLGRALSMSIGIATYPYDVHSVTELVERADHGMYSFKRQSQRI